MRFGMFGGLSFIWGDLIEREEKAYKDNRYLFTSGSSRDVEIQHSLYHGGFDIDLMLPAVKFQQIRRFSLSGIKFGIKSSYVFSEIQQEVYDKYTEGAIYGAKVLRYRSINAGPEINLIFSPRDGICDMVMQFYALGGYIHSGELTAAPGLRDEVHIDKCEYSAGFNGYSVTAGTGIFAAFNKGFPGIIGFTPYFSYTKIKFDKSVSIYDKAGSSSYYEIGVDLSLGIHI